MKRIIVLLAALALMLSLFAGCGVTGRRDDGSNVSTTDDGTVNGVNPDGPGVIGGMDDGTADGRDIAAGDGRTVTGTGVTEDAGTHSGSR